MSSICNRFDSLFQRYHFRFEFPRSNLRLSHTFWLSSRVFIILASILLDATFYCCNINSYIFNIHCNICKKCSINYCVVLRHEGSTPDLSNERPVKFHRRQTPCRSRRKITTDGVVNKPMAAGDDLVIVLALEWQVTAELVGRERPVQSFSQQLPVSLTASAPSMAL